MTLRTKGVDSTKAPHQPQKQLGNSRCLRTILICYKLSDSGVSRLRLVATVRQGKV